MALPAQRYTNPHALERMSRGMCPECGENPADHGGWGGPGCSLTDNGVADRIEQYRKDLTQTQQGDKGGTT
jgi:hypothetical protein